MSRNNKVLYASGFYSNPFTTSKYLCHLRRQSVPSGLPLDRTISSFRLKYCGVWNLLRNVVTVPPFSDNVFK